MLSFGLVLFTCVACCSAQGARPDFLKRYSNDTALITSVASNSTTFATDIAGQQAVQQDSIMANSIVSVALGPSVTTITRRTTVTASPTQTIVSTTDFPLSILLDPLVAVVAALPEDDVVGSTQAKAEVVTSRIVSYQTVYLPTTIYVTRPCTVASAAIESSAQSASTKVVTQTVTVAVTSATSNAGATADVKAQEMSQTSAAAPIPAINQAVVISGQEVNAAAAVDAITVSTTRVTQTMYSTTTVRIAAPTTSVPVMSVMPPYSNSTISM